MKLNLDCVPCLIRQSVEAVRLVSSDESFRRKIINEILETIKIADLNQSPPVLSQLIHRRIRDLSGNADPYEIVKAKFNALAFSMLQELTARIDQSAYPLHSVVKLAVAGNIIDSGAKSGLSEAEIKDAVNRVFSETFYGDIDEFFKSAAKAKKILYLADNAGEIVFDRLLIEKLGHPAITIAVRGYPVINDATIQDAIAAGLDKIATIIENGSNAPGTLLEECSPEFLKRFAEADFIISKGQGNYETLCDVKKNIYFLLRIKCPFIADHAGFPIGSNALIRSAQYSSV